MYLDYFMVMILVIFIAVPERILSEFGFETEKMNIIPFVLVWILLIAAICLFIKMIFWITKFSRRFIAR